jgi:hypothetical protein
MTPEHRDEVNKAIEGIMQARSGEWHNMAMGKTKKKHIIVIYHIVIHSSPDHKLHMFHISACLMMIL